LQVRSGQPGQDFRCIITTVAVTVAVTAPLIVAALASWNDIVEVIDAVRRSGSVHGR
jgi:hypothetical protein